MAGDVQAPNTISAGRMDAVTARRWMLRTGPRGRTLVVLGAGALVAVLAGCGSGSSAEVSPQSGPTTTPGAPPSGTFAPVGPETPGPTDTNANGPVSTSGPATQLKIDYNDGAGKVSHWTLTCDPAGGTHPHPALACRTLAAHGKQGLAPVPKGVMCPQIFSGNQTATITGTWKGNPVNASLKLSNGCETGRWRSLSGLLPNVPRNGVQ